MPEVRYFTLKKGRLAYFADKADVYYKPNINSFHVLSIAAINPMPQKDENRRQQDGRQQVSKMHRNEMHIPSTNHRAIML